MRYIITFLFILFISGCSDRQFFPSMGYKWSAEEIAAIPNGTPREDVLKKLGRPHSNPKEHYNRAKPISNVKSDTWYHNGSTLSGRRFQEQVKVEYDENEKVINVEYYR